MGIECASIVYDPIQRLIYAADTAQTVFALHTATGAQVWSYQVMGTIGQPVLGGGGLCLLGVTESVGVYVYWIDTAAALTQASNSQPVTPAWQQQVGQYIGILATAYVDPGTVYVVAILTDIESTVEQLWRLDVTAGPLAAPATGGTLIAFSVNSGTANSVCFSTPPPATSSSWTQTASRDPAGGRRKWHPLCRRRRPR